MNRETAAEQHAREVAERRSNARRFWWVARAHERIGLRKIREFGDLLHDLPPDEALVRLLLADAKYRLGIELVEDRKGDLIGRAVYVGMPMLRWHAFVERELDRINRRMAEA